MNERQIAGKLQLNAERAKEVETYANILSSNLDIKDQDLMKVFNCDPEWPICMFDFTYKHKTNHQ